MTVRQQQVLVVDDDPLTRDVLETILDLEEFSVEVAVDGQEGWERLSKDGAAFDVLVADVMMPRLDGLELVKRIRDAEPPLRDIAIVLLTARTGDDDRARGEAAGCDAYLTKPFSPLELIDLIASLNGDGSGRGAGSGRSESGGESV